MSTFNKMKKLQRLLQQLTRKLKSPHLKLNHQLRNHQYRSHVFEEILRCGFDIMEAELALVSSKNTGTISLEKSVSWATECNGVVGAGNQPRCLWTLP